MFRKSSLGLKREGTPPHNKCEHASIDLYGGIHLRRKLHRHLWEGAWISQVWRKKQDNWPKVNKDLEGLSHISDLNTSRLCSSSLRTPLQVCISALLLNWMNKLFSRVLSHTLCYVSNHKCRTCFYSFCLLETVLLTNRGKSLGHFCFLPLVPGGLVARTLGFHPGSPGLIPGRELGSFPLRSVSSQLLCKVKHWSFYILSQCDWAPGPSQAQVRAERRHVWKQWAPGREAVCDMPKLFLTIFQTEQALVSEKLETSTSEQ